MVLVIRMSSLFFFFNDTAPPEIYTYLHTLSLHDALPILGQLGAAQLGLHPADQIEDVMIRPPLARHLHRDVARALRHAQIDRVDQRDRDHSDRSEEHTSELQSLMRISYAVFCLKKKTYNHYTY